MKILILTFFQGIESAITSQDKAEAVRLNAKNAVEENIYEIR